MYRLNISYNQFYITLNEIWLYESDPHAPSTCSEPGGKQWQHSIRGWRNSWFAAADNKPIKWPNTQTISYTEILSWIINHMHVKMWIEVTDPFSNVTGLAAQWSVEMDK